MRRDEKRTECEGQREDRVRKSDQTEEARKAAFVRSNDNHPSSVSNCSLASAKIGVPWAKSRRSNGHSSRRRSDRRMAFWSEQYFAGSRVNPYRSTLISASPITIVPPSSAKWNAVSPVAAPSIAIAEPREPIFSPSAIVVTSAAENSPTTDAAAKIGASNCRANAAAALG